jgi:polyphosphate glucokinase
MKILVIDVGGNNCKMLLSGQAEPRRFPSGSDFNPKAMVKGVLEMTRDWAFDVVAIGFPAPCTDAGPKLEPVNLGKGWVGFDYAGALGKPVKFMNDAAMQALGSYEGGKMLFLGLGTGLGNAMIVDGVVLPMELAHLPYKKGSFEDYVGDRGRDKYGKKKWQKAVEDVIERLRAALQPDYVVLGGGNVKKLEKLPENVRVGSNDNAFTGGFRLWELSPVPASSVTAPAKVQAGKPVPRKAEPKRPAPKAVASSKAKPSQASKKAVPTKPARPNRKLTS